MKSRFFTVCSWLLCCSCMGAWAQSSVLNFSGRVVDNSGKGVSGVVVNDGIHFTKTNGKGNWTLATDTAVSKFVAISTPAAYRLPQQEGLADGFYIPVGKLAGQGNKHDFVLEKRKQQPEDFYFIAVSDPQVRTAADMKRWRQETVPDMVETVDSLKQAREVVGVTLGDLVFDNMPLFEEYKESLKNTGATFFQCIGNHDFEKQYQDLHNMALGTPVYGEMYYHRYFGPTDYSFNIGKVHFITLKNLNYVGGKKYMESLTGQQLEWLKNDLRYVPKGSLVIVNMHAAGWNKVANGGNIRNAKALEEVLKGYNVHVFCGHTHFAQNNEVSESLYEHNIGAACGTWWSGWVNQCGAPNGYMVVDVQGSNLKWHYKGTRRDFSYQFRLYGKGEFLTQSSCVVANIWDWDSACRVVWYQDGKLMGDMQQFTDADETVAAQKKNRSQAVPTPHLFRAMPADGAKEVKVVFTNRFGEQHTQMVKL
ncbi:MAG: calcineurin-like phosphoesterase C-terminal domain-containing protein [Bacteroides sp.]|nr:calcineurin-like phosphoesterase C-terminal domain-containing protein [Bacteroides sp.]